MNHGSLFSGIGGFDLAAEELGWNNVFHCEIEPFPRKVLNYYWPNAKSYEDIKTTDFTIHRGQIDVLTGGFPCQPYSLAGSRKGKEDDRHLWPEMLRAIRECCPTWIVGENVPGIISWNGGLVFEEVCIDLENEGYEVQPIILPAASKDAPHKRDRVWFVAYSDSERWNNRRDHREERQIQDHGKWSTEKDKPKRNRWKRGAGQVGEVRDTSNAKRQGLERKNRGRMEKPIQSTEQTTTNPNHQRFKECNNAGITEQQEWSDRKFTPLKGWQNFPTQPPVRSGNDGIPADTHRRTIQNKNTMDRSELVFHALKDKRLVVDFETGKIYSTVIRGRKGEKVELKSADCNGYVVHNIYYKGVKKQCRAHQIVWIAANGLYDKDVLMIDHINRDRTDNRLVNLRLVDAQGNRDNATPYNGKLSQDEIDKMYFLHKEGNMTMRELAEDFGISKSRVQQLISEHPGLDGITFSKWRNESIKGYGNAVVPQVVVEIFKVIEEMNNQ